MVSIGHSVTLITQSLIFVGGGRMGQNCGLVLRGYHDSIRADVVGSFECFKGFEVAG